MGVNQQQKALYNIGIGKIDWEERLESKTLVLNKLWSICRVLIVFKSKDNISKTPALEQQKRWRH